MFAREVEERVHKHTITVYCLAPKGMETRQERGLFVVWTVDACEHQTVCMFSCNFQIHLVVLILVVAAVV